MKVDIKVPGVGESITEGLLAAWSAADGSVVIEGQAIFELETDKTTIDVTAPATGTLTITVPEGTEVTISQVVGTIDTEKADTRESESVESESVEKNPVSSDTGGRITPAARKAASEENIDPGSVTGTGRGAL